MAEPISLADMRIYLRLAVTQIDEDALISSMITAARRACEFRLNRSVLGETRTAVFSGFPSYPYYLDGRVPVRQQLFLALPGGTVSSVTSITYYDSANTVQTLDPLTYGINAGRLPAVLAPVSVWPASYDRSDALTVTYVISPLSVDDQAVVVMAIKLLVGHWFENRTSVAADMRGTPAEMPMSVSWMLQPMRVIPFR